MLIINVLAAQKGGVPRLAQPSHKWHKGQQKGRVSCSAVAHRFLTGAAIVFAWRSAESQVQSALIKL